MSEWMTEREVAARLKVEHRTVQRWRLEKRGPAYHKLPTGAIRYRLADIEAFENANRIEPANGKSAA